MQNYIKDVKLLEFTKLLIFCNRKEISVGIPIGNYTSQFFANIYLNELNSYIKRTLKIKFYVRYMDDFQTTIQSLNSWLGHSSHCNSYKLQRKIINKCKFIYK